ncbi:putative phosphatidylinositol transfer protein 1 [Monocercomonoides exilis]|uniref:putative phosphatidylinositol transfer protein 1 n=1 Tax=Monocercomonoides exilis TaxID=2049356 RepID=UPI00355997EE|nr:putative phosphatidylinositol transfer protein 1 [Monocercomonoides exilis]|eukprot:MONOS_7339.1-p1 / transcript=MONOS_7339.1 / gene=MONOS_7339 / organism=Monocercomonoides_exilis_PA203 / gene_product=phosphatidylinositol transfer protein 1 / transcript_product=phosphatidylinositol transfer protein 1 / location=Mono_scaffold00248:75099-76515(-) / protein_length=350 / sequence_SO=supercontig / SO=protein_coding / is_pseudo=false
MRIVEYRITVPLNIKEYPLGATYIIAKASLQNSGSGDGIDLITDEPFIKDGVHGRHTFKRMHVGSKVPGFVRAVVPKTSLILEEESWNAFPYTKTTYSNVWLKDRFKMVVETRHLPGPPVEENIHNLSESELKMRKIELIDLGVKAKSNTREYKCKEDPTTFKSEKTGRGPLVPKWWESPEAKEWPVVTCYKLLRVELKWFGLQTLVESYVPSLCRTIFGNTQRQLFCWIDEYYGMSESEILDFAHSQYKQSMVKMKESPPPEEQEEEYSEEEQKAEEQKFMSEEDILGQYEEHLESGMIESDSNTPMEMGRVRVEEEAPSSSATPSSSTVHGEMPQTPPVNKNEQSSDT